MIQASEHISHSMVAILLQLLVSPIARSTQGKHMGALKLEVKTHRSAREQALASAS